MYLNNYFINIHANKISNFHINYDYEKIINLIISIIKKCKKVNKYPTSEDLINFLSKNEMYYDNLIEKFIFNLDECKIKNYTYDLCAICSIYSDNINFELLLENSKIFDKIFLINYSDNIIETDIPNVIILNSSNKNSDLTYLFLSHDLLFLSKFIYNLDLCENIFLAKGSEIVRGNNIIKKFINDLNSIYNLQIFELIEFKNNLYFKSSYKILYSSFNQFVLCQKEVNKYYKSKKKIKIPILSKNISLNDEIYRKDLICKYNFINKNIDEINSLEDYLVYYNENLIIKNKLNDTLNFIENILSAKLFDINFSYYEKNNVSIIYNSYDYQVLDNSIIIVFNSKNIFYDFIFLFYFIHLAKNFNKKIFIKWTHDIKVNEILMEDFYYYEECNDNIKNYNLQKYTFDGNISLHNITFAFTIDLPITFYDYTFLENCIGIKLSYDINNINSLNDKYLLIDSDKHILFEYMVKIECNYINLDELKKIVTNNTIFEIIRFILIKNSNLFIYNRSGLFDHYISENSINFDSIVYDNKNVIISDYKLYESENPLKVNYDNQYIGNNSDFEEIDKIINSPFINNLSIITELDNLKMKNYKLSFIKNSHQITKIYNHIAKNSQNQFIFISNYNFDSNLFRLPNLEFNNFFSNDDILYISTYNFKKLNGFNENICDLKEAIKEFTKRSSYFKLNNLNKNYVNDYELETLWGLENKSSKFKVRKINLNFYELY